MPKNKVSEWSSTPANNTDIGGINIAEGCAPSGINNAIRELMAQVKDMQAGTDADGLVVGGTLTCSGAAVMSSTLTVAGATTFSNNVIMSANNTFGDASTDAHTLNGTMTAATGAKILLDDSVTNATAPVLAFDGDTNTGIYRPAADTFSIGTNGAERLRIANAGVIVNQAMTCSGAAVMSSTLAVSGAATFNSSVALGSNATATTQVSTDNSTKVATTAFVRDIIPSGVILMWSGSVATIPNGWLLCNGSNGTPDLRNRFIVGAGSTYSVAGTGGSADAIVVSHTHTATVTDPGHRHTWGYGVETDDNGSGGSFAEYTRVPGSDATAIQIATTGITVSNSTTGSSGTNANLPPYFALCFIMKS